MSSRAPRRLIISAPRLSPEVWCAPLGPSSPAASLGAENSSIQRLDPEKSPENHRRAIHITEVASTKRIPSANYSLSIALQENALRVMCLTRGTPGSAPAEPGLLQRRPPHQPWEAPCRLSFGAPRRLIISAPRLSPEVPRARLGPSSLAARLGAKNSQIQRLDLEKSPENHRRATDSDEVCPTKRIPSANYSLSIALQENALRVMCLLPQTPGSASG